MGIFGPVKEKLNGPCVLFMTRNVVGDAVLRIMNSWGKRYIGRFANTVGTMGREVNGKASWETVTWKTSCDGSWNVCDQIPDARWSRLQHCAHGGADIVGSLVRSLLNGTILALRILRWLLEFLWVEMTQDLVK